MSRDSKLDMSALYSQNVPAPEPLPSRVQDASAADVPSAPARSTTPTPARQRETPAAPVEPPAPKTQVNFYTDPALYTRFKKAHRATLAHTDFDSLSAHLSQLLLNECERLEKEHNDGRPFGS